MPLRIISGGQTGVDRAALDAAMAGDLPCGGWCPKGRRAEDGNIDPRYPLRETPLADYRQRTEWNVRDSDGTLILHRGQTLRGGTALTHRLAVRRSKPVLVVAIDRPVNRQQLLDWLIEHGIRTVNVAGPRESQDPGIHERAQAVLASLFSALRDRASACTDTR